MPDPSILIDLRKREDTSSTEFVRRYDRLKELTALKFERRLLPSELEEILLLRNLVRQSLALWLEKR
jgi:hypothetical protein